MQPGATHSLIAIGFYLILSDENFLTPHRFSLVDPDGVDSWYVLGKMLAA